MTVMLDLDAQVARFAEGGADVWPTLYREAREEAIDHLARFVAWRRFVAIRAEVERRLALAEAAVARVDEALPDLEAAAERADATHRAAFAQYEAVLARADRAEYRQVEQREHKKTEEPARAAGAAARVLEGARTERALATLEVERWRSLLALCGNRQQPDTPLLAELGIGAPVADRDKSKRRG